MTGAEATGCEAMLALSFSTLEVKKCDKKTGKVSTRVNAGQNFR